MVMNAFLKNYSKDKVRWSRMEYYDIRREEELAFVCEHAQRQFDANIQQNQMMTTMMQFSMMVCLHFSLPFSRSVHCTHAFISNSSFLV